MANDPHSIGDILDQLGSLADEQDRVSLGDALEAFGNRSYGPFLLVPTLIEISPIGGIPGLPTVLAAVIILFAAQIIWGRSICGCPASCGGGPPRRRRYARRPTSSAVSRAGRTDGSTAGCRR